MKEEPNIDETIHKIEQILEDKQRNMHYVHAGTLMDILALLKEQKNQIGVLERTIERMPKPVKLLDVFGNGYASIVRCKDCKHGEKEPTFEHYPDVTWCNKHLTSHNDDWFCADGKRRCSNE